jgi:uroporphyrinogen-III synthase
VTLLPLNGFVVGVTADRRAAEQAELLRRRGAAVVHGPTIRTAYLADDDALRQATAAVIQAKPDYLVATTGIGMRAWHEAAQAWGLGDDLTAALAGTRIAARGPKAAAVLRGMGLDVWRQPETEQLAELLAVLTAEPLEGRSVAFQHHGDRSVDATDALAAAGAQVIEAPVYQWRIPEDDAQALRLIDAACAHEVDAVTFTSAPAIHNMFEIAARHGRDAELRRAFNQPQGVVAACIGSVCAEGARAMGVCRAVTPGTGRLGLMVRALSDALQEQSRELRLASTDIGLQGRALRVGDTTMTLSQRERAVLDLLVERQGRVVSKEAMLRAGWPDGANERAVEATIRRLRARLGPAGPALRSVRGRGYVLDTG